MAEEEGTTSKRIERVVEKDASARLSGCLRYGLQLAGGKGRSRIDRT